mmetsp:Transcript_4563/g.10058  ORF Transcript_4563/g.10058 Transcript_4563/m.10058 type:complete len:515 (+) Transcript_4563:69-1613(+)
MYLELAGMPPQQAEPPAGFATQPHAAKEPCNEDARSRGVSSNVVRAVTQSGPPSLVLLPPMRRWLVVLSVTLGFGQGCGLCFTVGSGGFYGERFHNSRFLIYLCAFFFLPPIVVTVLSVMFDTSFNIKTGARLALRFRIYVSGLMVMACIWALCLVSGPVESHPLEMTLVLALTVVIGLFGAVLLSSSSALLGTADAGLVPCVILGQTAAGVYTNIVADTLGFEPNCPPHICQAYWAVAGGTLLAVMIVFFQADMLGYLEILWAYHQALLDTLGLDPPEAQPSNNGLVRGSQARVASPRWSYDSSDTYNPVERRLSLMREVGRTNVQCCQQDLPDGARQRFGWTCWSMALCQALAIALNMSLTPLSNQMAHGDYDLTQTLVLVKLLSDFAGRTCFFLLPRPDTRSHGTFRSMKVQATLVWLVAAYRIPLWLCQYVNARIPLGAASWTRFLDNYHIRLWGVWLPMVSTGAMSSSWCIVIALNSVSEELRGTVNLLMTASIYLGYFWGIGIALLSS